jgi:hypothetical protein
MAGNHVIELYLPPLSFKVEERETVPFPSPWEVYWEHFGALRDVEGNALFLSTQCIPNEPCRDSTLERNYVCQDDTLRYHKGSIHPSSQHEVIETEKPMNGV